MLGSFPLPSSISLFSQRSNCFTTSEPKRICHHFLLSDHETKPQSRILENSFKLKKLAVHSNRDRLRCWGHTSSPLKPAYPRPPPLAEEPPPSVSASRQSSHPHGSNLLTVNRSQLKRDSTKRASLIKPCLHERSSYATAIPAHHLFLCTKSLSRVWAVAGWPSLSCVLSPTRMVILRSVLGTKRT